MEIGTPQHQQQPHYNGDDCSTGSLPDPFPALPEVIYNTKTQNIPLPTYLRLNYLWQAANKLIYTSPQCSHRLSMQFVDVVNESNSVLPEHIMDRLCSHCFAVQISAVTCKVRLQPRTRRSQVNRHTGKRLKNQVVSTCLVCNNLSKRSAPGYSRKALAITGSSSSSSSSGGANNVEGTENGSTADSTKTSGAGVEVQQPQQPSALIKKLMTHGVLQQQQQSAAASSSSFVLPELGKKRKKSSLTGGSINPSAAGTVGGTSKHTFKPAGAKSNQINHQFSTIKRSDLQNSSKTINDNNKGSGSLGLGGGADFISLGSMGSMFGGAGSGLKSGFDSRKIGGGGGTNNKKKKK